ncbi:4'-phosphopantetheinyl transferase superfamily protein [Actinoplanes sp. NPDC026670]|uniref:4'-phosphopantetheinyl transferase family protein n=1 Tax=Actinoplanes sp. NPDC026670 TaxID=3154700 RepID=UPI0033DB0CB8
MIEALLPDHVMAVEAFTDITGEPPFPGEEDLVANAVEVRRREFVTARRCARQALAALGHPAAPIRAGARREPIWPAAVVGSITHCAGYRAAAVARRPDLAGLGIDAEPHERLPAGIEESVTVPSERAHLRQLSDHYPAVRWDRLLFSAKESVYKAWYPLTGRWLGFEDAELTFEPSAGVFRARILVDGTRRDAAPPLTEIGGRFLIGGGFVLTAASVAA